MAAKKHAESNKRQGPGESAMGPWGIILVVGYTLLVMGFVVWSLVALWPAIRPEKVRDRIAKDAEATPTPSPTASPTPGASPAATALAGVQPRATPTPSPTPSTSPTTAPTARAVTEPDCETAAGIKEGFCLDEKGVPRDGVGALKYFGRCYCIYDEDRLLLIVLLAGALGALVHALRSLSWYIGNRRAVWSWSAMYFMLPFLGAGLAVIFYLVIRGGFFSPTSTVADTSPFGFAAMAALVGMFTEPAVTKLRKVAINLLEPPDEGKDHVGPAPKITEISPKQGLVTGAEPVTITGENFSSNAKVTFGGVEATVTSASETSISVMTPLHAKGKVSVVVTNPEDKQVYAAKEAFEYTEPSTGGVGTAGAAGAKTAPGAVSLGVAGSDADVETMDGCGLEVVDETPDEALPISEGGVE